VTHHRRRAPRKVLGESCRWLRVTLSSDDTADAADLAAIQTHDQRLVVGCRTRHDGGDDRDASDEDDARQEPTELGIQAAYGALALEAGTGDDATGFTFGSRAPLVTGAALLLGAALG
jgi:hypothetical protein